MFGLQVASLRRNFAFLQKMIKLSGVAGMLSFHLFPRPHAVGPGMYCLSHLLFRPVSNAYNISTTLTSLYSHCVCVCVYVCVCMCVCVCVCVLACVRVSFLRELQVPRPQKGYITTLISWDTCQATSEFGIPIWYSFTRAARGLAIRSHGSD
jgi:hypothetical protein